MKDKIENENSEVDLRDYLKLIYSKKWLFLFGFIAPVIIAVIYNFSAPKIYEVRTWLELGYYKASSTADLIELIETPEQIKRKINNNIYGDFNYRAVILNPSQTNLIQIKIESVNPGNVQNDLEKISEAILADHAEKIKMRRNALENEIKTSNNNIDSLEKEAKALEAKIETPLTKRGFEMMKDRILIKYKDVNSIKDKIAYLKGLLDYVFDTRVVKPAVISEHPIKPRSLINIVLAAMIGLFWGIVIVFLKKWKEDFRG